MNSMNIASVQGSWMRTGRTHRLRPSRRADATLTITTVSLDDLKEHAEEVAARLEIPFERMLKWLGVGRIPESRRSQVMEVTAHVSCLRAA
jgi:hypothetical protein